MPASSITPASKDGFMRGGGEVSGMSTATKIVLVTVLASALLSILLVFQTVLV